MAAVLAVGDGVLSHLPAVALRRISRFRATLPHVLVQRRHRPIDGIVIHECRTLDPRDVTVYHGIPVTTVPRTLVDLSDELTKWQVANLMHEAAYRKCFDVTATRRALERANGRRGVAVVERAIELHLAGSAGTKSALEDAFLALLGPDVPEPLVNMELEGLEVDCQWPDRSLVVEVDGPAHRRPAAKREDARRDALLRAAGYTVLRFNDAEIERSPGEVLARLLCRL